MKTATTVPAPLAPIGRAEPLTADPSTMQSEGRTVARSRFVAYAELTKPRIALMVLFTVVIGAVLGGGGRVDLLLLVHTVVGTTLVAAGASALNMYLERRADARMRRTENRPLPAKRLLPVEALLFGTALGVGGFAYLWAMLPQAWAALVAAITFVTYVFVYTPLKRVTPLNTLVGAVPGALPPLIGWTAARGSLDVEAAGLFLIVFFWQVPHFLAIAWIHRDDYARGGFRMLPVVDRDGAVTGRNMVVYCLALLPASLLPTLGGHVGLVYVVGALTLGLAFLVCTLGFLRTASTPNARRVLRGSLLYLPAVLALLLIDGLVQRF
jgi:protoheme IX farnesyltransferase